MQIRPLGADLFHEDGQTGRHTEMTKLSVAIRNFANALNIHHIPKFFWFKERTIPGGGGD